MMTRSLTVALATLLAAAGAHPGHHPPMSPEMHKAMNDVEVFCSKDVSYMCPLSVDEPVNEMKTPVLRLGAPRDPLLEFLSNPEAPPPMIMDMSNILDQMMSHSMLMANDEPQFSIVRIISFGDDERSPYTGEQENAAPEKVLDSMVDQLVQRSAEHENPQVVVKKIVQHANEILKNEKDEDRVRLARRLTELDPDAFRSSHLPLPFGCARNRCLMAAFEQGATSSSCTDALKTAEAVQSHQRMQQFDRAERDSELFLSFTVLYAVLALITLAVAFKKLRKMRNHINKNFNLMKGIMQAVYSNPAIKAKVEESLGTQIGFVPPLPPHVLAELGGEKFPHRGLFFVKMVMFATFAAIFTLVFVNPLLVMPILCILMFARFLRLAFFPPHHPTPKCSCCCCGLSTDDVQNGNISATQACCTCCNSMGVCAPGCADCCGLDPDGACDCCTDGCDCCSGKDSCKKPLLPAEKGIYQGIPIQVV